MKELCLTIPCEPGTPDLSPPIYPAKDGTLRWECPMCGLRFYRRKPCITHMGKVINHPHSCPTLKAEEDKRRAELRRHLAETRKEVGEESEPLSFGLSMIRNRERANK